MRTLICVIGQPREEKLIWNNFKKFIITDDTDLCLCGDKKDNEGIMKQHAKYVFEYDQPQGDITNGFELMKEYENGLDQWKQLGKIPNNWIQPLGDPAQASQSCGLLIFYRWFLWKNLKEHDLLDKYDRFVLTRSDYMHTHELPVDNESILIPGFEFHGGVTDRLAIIPQKFVENFLRIGTLIVQEPALLLDIFTRGEWPLGKRLGRGWGWNLETYILIALHLTKQWDNIKFFGPTMFTVMSAKNPKYKSVFNEPYQCYLRYQTEYNNLTETPGIIFSSKDIDFWYLEDDMFIGKLNL